MDKQQLLIERIQGPRVIKVQITKRDENGNEFVETLKGDDVALWQAYTQSVGIFAHGHGANPDWAALNWQRRDDMQLERHTHYITIKNGDPVCRGFYDRSTDASRVDCEACLSVIRQRQSMDLGDWLK
jgi:hypothetical protein